MSDDSLPTWIRGQLEQEIDSIVEHPKILEILTYADIPLNEETILAYTFGQVMAIMGCLYRFSNRQMPQSAKEEVFKIIRSRRQEIVGAYREHLDD